MPTFSAIQDIRRRAHRHSFAWAVTLASVGGISARPEVPFTPLLMENLLHYSSLPNQPYPLNVRLELQLISQNESTYPEPYSPIPFSESQNLYQKVKKCLRTKKSLDEIVVHA